MQDSGRRIRPSLRMLIYSEANFWFGHCLDFDIVAEGSTPEEAVRNCAELCAAQFNYATENGNIESIFRSAPPAYWQMYSIAKDFPLPSELSELMLDAEARELEFA